MTVKAGHGGKTYVKITVLEGSATTETTTVTDLMRGDVNEDKTVDVRDAVLLARIVGGDATAVVTKTGLANAELDGEENLTTGDLTVLLKALVHLVELI